MALGQPLPKHEFRGVWVATVANIDWPSKPGLKTRQQKKEVVRILDLLQQLKMNAVIVQIRPEADAFYPSVIEPWSKYLTGTPGREPSPHYDPLQFWVEESHKRGMEFHAWLNPYRVAQQAEKPIAGNHIAFAHPEWVVKYGDKLYFDPAFPEVRQFVTHVATDIVKRYDIDAIHFDDYFYPYPTKEEFPDTTSFKQYGTGFSQEEKGDWRRQNVDRIVSMLYDSIKSVKPWVKFGISPFGVWRNKKEDQAGSETNGGLTNYDHLYADILKWLQEGWIDYIVPQLYWRIGHPAVDFMALANWWAENNSGRHLYIGHGLYKVDKNSTIKDWATPSHMPNQVLATRSIPAISGSAFYSVNHLKRDLLGFQDSLQNQLYPYHSIIPAMDYLPTKKPPTPAIVKRVGKKVKWEKVQPTINMPRQNRFIVYKTERGTPFNPETPSAIYTITSSTQLKFKRENKKKKEYEVRVSTLNRLNVESETTPPIILKL